VLERLGTVEKRLFDTPVEVEVRQKYRARAEALDHKLQGLPTSLDEERRKLAARHEALRTGNGPVRDYHAAQRALHELPKTEPEARNKWESERRSYLEKAERPVPHAEAFPGATEGQRDAARRNFFALVVCLMVGTAALPHILMRYYTTPSVREARESVFWSLFFISLLYLTAPAYAVFAKWVVYNDLVGTHLSSLPSWVASWGKVGLVKVEDVNGDGILQLAELTLNSDVIVLATPEIAGLPYVVSGLIAAGGLAAALSTADGLLLTIANALSHDLYYKILAPRASVQWRLIITKGLLLFVAMVAAWMASLKPDGILFMVGLAFSIAAASFFPALVLGIFWQRANKWGAIAGMLGGLAVVLWYVLRTHPFFHGSMEAAWFDIQPIAAGIFGLPVGFVLIVAVSLLTPAPSSTVQDLVQRVRYPNLEEK
jgi:cation/acetate symporter